jgi:hypothetical protein
MPARESTAKTEIRLPTSMSQVLFPCLHENEATMDLKALGAAFLCSAMDVRAAWRTGHIGFKEATP